MTSMLAGIGSQVAGEAVGRMMGEKKEGGALSTIGKWFRNGTEMVGDWFRKGKWMRNDVREHVGDRDDYDSGRAYRRAKREYRSDRRQGVIDKYGSWKGFFKDKFPGLASVGEATSSVVGTINKIQQDANAIGANKIADKIGTISHKAQTYGDVVQTGVNQLRPVKQQLSRFGNDIRNNLSAPGDRVMGYK